MSQKRKKKSLSNKARKRLSTFLIVLTLLAGIGLISYPTVANYWNKMHQSRAIMTYMDDVSDMSKEQYQQMISAAEDYNNRLAQSGPLWNMTKSEEKEYESLLNYDDTGIMGYIQIPKINVELPIYHGTDDSVLQTSVGHLAGSSLPVGGASSHCVLSGHRGLPSARLFTDLDQLKEGDVFTINVLNETLTYEVDQIRIVEPNDFSDLQIEDGKDYCTLMTCTPYGINTHRLLVRGHRIPNQSGNAEILSEAIQIRPVYVIPFVAAFFVAVLILILLIKGKKDTHLKEKYMKEHDLPEHQDLTFFQNDDKNNRL